MTRIELAKNLLVDDSKLDEEVFIYDNDYGEYFEVCDIGTKQIDELSNGKFIPLQTGRFARFRDKDAVIKTVTVISWKERCDWKK